MKGSTQDYRRQPGIPLEWEGGVWRCPKTGITVRMDQEGNARQRMELLEACEQDPELQEEIWSACAESFELWVNLFAWTYVIFEVLESGERVARTESKDEPFILWPCQSACYRAAEMAAQAGRDLGVPKSRDMGATWLLLIARAVHGALFLGHEIGLASRKEDLVEKKGDPDALFTKIDYMVKWLPAWMVGKVDRRDRFIGFETGGTITGETTNKDAFRGGRKQWIGLDEAASMANLEAILRACKDAGPVVAVSTHEIASHFATVCTDGTFDVFWLGWHDHPQKGRGRELVVDPETGQEEWTSPWLRVQEQNRTARDVALNIKGDPGAAGSMVFDLKSITHQIATYGRNPNFIGDVVMPDASIPDRDAWLPLWPMDDLLFDERHGGLLRIWGELMPDQNGRMRLNQEHFYSIGVDIGDGVGATPTVASITDVNTGDKVGKWKDRETRPESFSALLYQLAHWVGGPALPIVVPEANGGRGSIVIQDFKKWSYPNLYRHVELTKRGGDKSDQLGWMSTRPRKQEMLAAYGKSLFSGEFRNPDVEALEQARRYIHYDGGGVGPPEGLAKTDEELAEHGDDVIADGLSDLGRQRYHLQRPKAPEAKRGTVAWARQRLRQPDRKPWQP